MGWRTSIFKNQTPIYRGDVLWLSVLGAFLSLIVVGFVSQIFLPTHYPYLVASMGAAVVLVFLAPGNSMAQPWAVLMGHLVSALVGVTCAKLISHHVLAVATTVSLAIIAMHYLRCLHPPGGAAALVPVLGDQHVADLGYWYVLAPVGINAAILVIIALLTHRFLTHTEYPADYVKLKNSDDYLQRDPFVKDYIDKNDQFNADVCKNAMSPLGAIVATSTSIEEVQPLLKQHSTDGLVAVNDAGCFTGVVTVTSLVFGVLACQQLEQARIGDRMFVGSNLTRLATVREDVPIELARELLADQGLEQVIVVDRKHRPIGRLRRQS